MPLIAIKIYNNYLSFMVYSMDPVHCVYELLELYLYTLKEKKLHHKILVQISTKMIFNILYT